MCTIARRHFEGSAAASAGQLAAVIGTPVADVHNAIALLSGRGLIVNVDTNPDTYLPGRAPERIGVSEVLEVLRGEIPLRHPTSDRLPERISAVFESLDQADAKKLAGLTLRDLTLDTPALTTEPTGQPPSAAAG